MSLFNLYFGSWQEISIKKVPPFALERLTTKKRTWERKHKFNAYNQTFYSKGNHFLYKLWCEAIQQGEYDERYYRKKRKHPKETRLEDLSKTELIERIKQLEGEKHES